MTGEIRPFAGAGETVQLKAPPRPQPWRAIVEHTLVAAIVVPLLAAPVAAGARIALETAQWGWHAWPW